MCSLPYPRVCSAPVLGQRLSRLLCGALTGFTLQLGGATSNPHVSPTLPQAGIVETGAPARPTNAWPEFCERHPQECAVNMAETAFVPLTATLLATLQAVNQRANTRIRPITDQAHWNTVDRWDLPDDGLGDCEDIQLLKRQMLVQRGLPRRALRMTVVIDELGEGHAVLMVRTTRGDLILDNKTNTILSWQQTGYTFVKREGQDGQGWVTLTSGVHAATTSH